MYHLPELIAERCLTQEWGKRYEKISVQQEEGKLTKGWKEGTPAHKRAVEWAKANFNRLKDLPWPIVFQQYLRACKRTSDTYDHF